jgi:hypothetical protein
MSKTTNTTESLDEIMKLIFEYARGFDVGCPEPSEEDIKQAIQQEVLRGRVDSLDTFATNFNNYAAEHRELFEPEIVGAVWGLLAQQTIPLNTLLGGER